MDFLKDLTGNLTDDQSSENEVDVVQIIASSESAELYINKPCFNVTVEQYSIILKKWMPIDCSNQMGKIIIPNLLPAHHYEIKVKSSNALLGSYEFTTRPENIKKFNVKIVDEDNIKLSWNNENKYETEIYRKVNDENWNKIDTTISDSYLDQSTEQGKEYQYRIRYKFDYTGISFYSDYTTVDGTYIQEDINNLLRVNGYVIVRQNDPLNKSISYPYGKNDDRTIGSSGCGVCASLMIIRNLTNYEPTLESYTKQVISSGGRVSNGSNIEAISSMMKKEYGISYSTTKDSKTLEEHLLHGGMAIAHVGTKRLFTSSSGHFVTIVGITKGKDGEARAIILDPSFYQSKYTTEERVTAGIEFSDNGIVTAPLDVVLSDCKDECITLYSVKK